MDPGWDHTENEDKLLLAHTLRMNRDVGTVTNLEMSINWVDGISCNDNDSVSEDRLISLSTEYGKYLSSVAINNVNYIAISDSSFLSFINSMLNIVIDRICLYSIWFKDFIFKIFNICSSDIKCQCNCKCDPQCKGNKIFLCLCECKPEKGSGCCICLCKHNDKCKCVCICICLSNKDRVNCCCQSGSHTCKKCLVKVDIGTLRTDTSTIVYYLNCIRCCLSIIENKCCSCGCCQNGRCGTQCCSQCQTFSGSSNTCCCCSCCPKGCSLESCKPYCCCKDARIDYAFIIPKIHFVEFLFGEVSTQILELTKMNKTLSCYCNKTQDRVCECCNSKDKIENLIKYTKNALRYYYLFGSRIMDIKVLVEYKVSYCKSKEIISSLEKLTSPLLNQLSEKNYMITNVDHARMANKLLMSVYSQYSIFQCYFAANKSYECSSKIHKIFEFIYSSYGCLCIEYFEKNTGIDHTMGDLWIKQYVFRYLSSDDIYKMKTDDEIKRLFGWDTSGNHVCLCMVIKYSLYPQTLNLVYVISYELDVLGTLSRKFTKYSQPRSVGSDIVKIIMLIVDLVHKICKFIESTFKSHFVVSRDPVYLRCFCMYSDDPSYSGIVSIILVLSSLIENIWTMDAESLRSTIECLSTLYSQLEIYDLSSVNDNKKLSCNSVYTLLLNKQCQDKGTCQCGKKSNGCCWCVTCFNLLVMFINLCLQCNLCKAICNNNKKPNGCDKVKDYFKFQKLECKCKCPENKGLCCLLKLALCSQVPSSTGNGCKDLVKLQECCKECQNGKGCCKTLVDKLKAGLCKVLLIGCCCNDDKCVCTQDSGEEVKVKCLMFNNIDGCTSVAVVVFCKCGEKSIGCCCIYNVVEKFKDKLQNLCKGEQCVCEELKKSCQDLCCDKECGECVCKQLKDKCKEICGKNCNGSGECLCKQIEKIKECSVSNKQCKCCKNKGGCCRCPPCKIVGLSLKILTRACRANVLEPYKRITIELLNSSKNKKEVIRSILERINRTTLNNIYLVKNNLITSTRYPYSVGSYEGTINSVTNVETRNWGYDTKYEHNVTTYNSIIRGDGYPHVTNPDNSYSNRNVRSNKAFKMILSRMLVGGVIVFVFIYIRLTIVFF